MSVALNRTIQAKLTNKSGGSVAQGDVVIFDVTTAAAFTTSTSGGYTSGPVGVVLEPNGIANNAKGLISFGGYVPKVNLSSAASLGDLFKTHTVAGQAVRHAAPLVAGDFGQVLGTGTSPAAMIFTQPIQTGYTDEQAQDAVGLNSSDTDTIDITYDDTVGTFKWDAKKQMSITSDASGLKLVNDLSAPGANKVYGTDSGGAKGWKADPSGGGGGALKTYYEVDAPPSSPHASNDEFLDASGGLPGGWTEFDTNSILTVNESVSFKGVILDAATRSGTNLAYIYKGLPVGDFAVWTKLAIGSSMNDFFLAGIGLFEDGTDATKRMRGLALIGRGAASVNWGLVNYTNTTTNTTSTWETSTSGDFLPESIYFRFRRVGSTWYWGYSKNGKLYLERGTAGHNPAFTPTHFGLFVDNRNTGVTQRALFDFFRVSQTAINLTDVMPGQLASIYA